MDNDKSIDEAARQQAKSEHHADAIRAAFLSGYLREAYLGCDLDARMTGIAMTPEQAETWRRLREARVAAGERKAETTAILCRPKNR